MKRVFWMSVVLGLFLCAGQLAAQELNGPKIEAREVKHDFGKVVQGTQPSHVFEIRNAGTKPLIIDRVTSS
jgi:hypothetical protein